MFNPRFSELSERLRQEDNDAWETHDLAVALANDGEDVILLCVGDPDFRTPEPIIDNAVSYLRVGRTHYSPALGEMKLRRAVADLETSTSPHPCSADEVAIFPGATNALFSVMKCLLNPGDEIVIPDPMYVGYPPIMASIGAKTVTIPLCREDNFSLDPDRVMDAVTEQTRAVLINNPSNPTGSVMSAACLKTLAALCRERGLWLVCDEVYSMVTFSGRHKSLRACADELDNVVMIDGLSKSHAMSGWRIGWAVGPRTLVERLGQIAGASLFGCPQFIQDASAFALGNDQEYVAAMREEYAERADYVVRKLRKLQGLHCHPPKAGMFVMVDVDGTGMNGRAFARRLLQSQLVSVVPGDAFGPTAHNCVRVGLAQPRHVLKRGLKRIARFIEALTDES
ncbi:MAG: pyridoxal phosphate-dependent aminotransferase [Pseudomonadota bacterium]